jgi:hydroxyacylglutathione hydrolase
VIIADPGREHEAATRLGRIGLDLVGGYLDDGMLSLERRLELTVTTRRLSARLAAERLASDDPPILVDVRDSREHDAKRIAGSLNIPLNHLVEGVEKLPDRRPLLLHCSGGYRSSIAASLLQQRRTGDVSEIAGGLAAWESAGLPLESELEPHEHPNPNENQNREPNVELDLKPKT